MHEEVKFLHSLPGQNNANTPQAFNNHQLVCLNGFKDPSYGISSSDDHDHGFNGYYFIDDKYPVFEGRYGIGDLNDLVEMSVVLFRKKEKNYAPIQFETY